MFSVVYIWCVTVFLVFCEVSQASPAISVQRESSRSILLSFPTTSDKSYQIYSSADLLVWKVLGSPVAGSGKSVGLKVDVLDRAQFFKVKEMMPITLRIQRAANQRITISFRTELGKKYQLFLSSDLSQWEAWGDLFNGTGDALTLQSIEPTDTFFKVEEVEVFPIANMVRIPAGTFVMGSPPTEKDRDLDEDPLTHVTLTTGFWMSKYEVTQREYQALMGENPSWFPGDLNLPVEQVTWKEATAYCARLTDLERATGRLPADFAYRLPTEAEFEYAARAGTSTRYSFGDDLDYSKIGDYAWYEANSGDKTHPVGQKLPNAWGLYDLHGNVWEWCLDWYGDRYPGGNVGNPTGAATGVARVFRGGGWDYTAASCRSAFRNNVSPTRGIKFLGFRIVLAPILTP